MRATLKTGRYNVGVGLLAMAGFMLYGFWLIYLRDLAPDREAWIASYGVGKHFEARLAHVHGGLFALINLALGFVLARLGEASERARELAAANVVAHEAIDLKIVEARHILTRALVSEEGVGPLPVEK